MKAHLIAALAFINPAFAQTGATVTVRVVSSVTKAPIGDANVTIDGATRANASQLAGRTDSSGEFSGKIELPGGHLISVRRNRYRISGTGVLGKTIEIQAGQADEFTVEMLPLAVIAPHHYRWTGTSGLLKGDPQFFQPTRKNGRGGSISDNRF